MCATVDCQCLEYFGCITLEKYWNFLLQKHKVFARKNKKRKEECVLLFKLIQQNYSSSIPQIMYSEKVTKSQTVQWNNSVSSTMLTNKAAFVATSPCKL